MTSSVDKRVREFDLRIPVSLVTDHQEHSRPVMALTCSENYVYSGGEDKTLCVWDRRSQSVLQTLRVCARSYILTCCNAGPTVCVCVCVCVCVLYSLVFIFTVYIVPMTDCHVLE